MSAYEPDFYGGGTAAIWTGNDLEQTAVTQPILDDTGAGLVNRGGGPAFAWVGFIALLVLLRVLVEVAEDGG